MKPRGFEMRGARAFATALMLMLGFTLGLAFGLAFERLGLELGDEGPAAWYSADNLPKLRRLKAKWDPSNVFGNGVSVY